MFTGIITQLGTFKRKRGKTYVFSAKATFCQQLEKGTSVCVNGTCLTVTGKSTKGSFTVALMPETEKKTMLGMLKKHDVVNLELPATPESFLSGHIVQGHVDGIGKIDNIAKEGNSRILTVAMNGMFARYIVEKGAIAINGVSLTVIDVSNRYVTVGIIPYTWTNTMFHTLKVGDRVNIEIDILAKYIERLSLRKER